MEFNEAVQIMTDEIVAILSDNPPTIYIYGSAVLGDFKHGWSDIDILVLTKRKNWWKGNGAILNMLYLRGMGRLQDVE